MENLGDDWYEFGMEAFARDTESEFRRLCSWLEITCPESLVEQVVSQTHHSVHESRFEEFWTAEGKELVNSFIRDHLSQHYDEWP